MKPTQILTNFQSIGEVAGSENQTYLFQAELSDLSPTQPTPINTQVKGTEKNFQDISGKTRIK